jgi:hypothetical protein
MAELRAGENAERDRQPAQSELPHRSIVATELGAGRARDNTVRFRTAPLNVGNYVRIGMAKSSVGGRRSRELPPYRAVMVVDAKGFSEQPSIEQSRINEEILRTLEASFSGARLTSAWQLRRFPAHDGDGYILGLPAEYLPLLIHPLLESIQAELEQRNRRPWQRAPLRLRASLNVGPLPDTGGPADGVGRPMTETHRLLDSAAARQALHGADERVTLLAAVVSQRVYEDVVEGGYCALHPTQFAAVEARSKNFAQRAYLHVPKPSGELLTSGLAERAGPPLAATPQQRPGGSTFVVRRSQGQIIQAHQIDAIHLPQDRPETKRDR